MESNQPLVSIVVTTRNEKLHIKDCLESLKKQTYRNIEVIVVDNNSSDNTKEISSKYTNLVFNKGPERSAQRNLGAEKAKGVFLVFIDADMILTERVIEECVQVFSDENIGGVVIPERSIGLGFWARVKSYERSFYEGDDSIEAARFFKKNIFTQVGGYDEKITGPEDWDLPQRIKKKYAIGRINSYIFHNEGKVSLLGLMKKKYYYGLKAPAYMRKTKSSGLKAQQTIYLLRPTFYRNWRKLLGNPILTFGMIIMLSLEQFSGLLGFMRGLAK